VNIVRIPKRLFISKIGRIILKNLDLALYEVILLIIFDSQDHLEKVQV